MTKRQKGIIGAFAALSIILGAAVLVVNFFILPLGQMKEENQTEGQDSAVIAAGDSSEETENLNGQGTDKVLAVFDNIMEEMQAAKEENLSEQAVKEEKNESGENELDKNNILNFDEALGTFRIPSDINRELVIGSYSENFPVILQEMLVYLNNDIDEARDDDWKKYEADKETITLETCGDIPFEEIADAAGGCSHIDNMSMLPADVDRDGRDEYIIKDSIGRGQLGSIYVVKDVEGKWTVIGGGNARYSTDVVSLLEQEGIYYILAGANLSYWRSESEIPDGEYWEGWDSAPWQADCWSRLQVQKKTAGYTLYEIYSNPRFSDSRYDGIAATAYIDMASLMDDTAEETLEETAEEMGEEMVEEAVEETELSVRFWDSPAGGFLLERGWKETFLEESYLYVIADMADECNKQGPEDRMLTVLCEAEAGKKEIVKIYYLTADYDIQLKEL